MSSRDRSASIAPSIAPSIAGSTSFDASGPRQHELLPASTIKKEPKAILFLGEPESAVEVCGRSDVDNYIVAEKLRASLLTPVENIPTPTPQPLESVIDQSTSSFSPPPQPDWQATRKQRMLAVAFRREYAPKPVSETETSFLEDATEEDDTSDSSKSANESDITLRDVAAPSPSSTSRKRARSPSSAQNTLLLHGLGDGRQRNELGRSLHGGQEYGIGVIGAGPDLDTDCDITMQTDTDAIDFRLRCIDSSTGRYMVGGLVISLEPDLPPLAKEHPARVWNSLVHSLDETEQPTLKYDYSTDLTPEGDEAFICQMAIALPPTHPAVQAHPGRHALPSNRYTSEYITEASRLGLAKYWSGDACSLKSDACNSALTRCLLDNGFEWLCPRQSISGASELAAEHASIHREQAPAKSPQDSATIVDAQIPAIRRSPVPQPLAENQTTKLLNLYEEVFAGLTPLNACLQFSTACNVGEQTFKETLTVGYAPLIKTYTSECFPSADAARQAVCRMAILDHVEDLMRTLHQIHAPKRQCQMPENDDMEEGASVDWIAQLRQFCRKNAMGFPNISQSVERAHLDSNSARDPKERPLFRGKIELESESFEAGDAHTTILEARQEIAHHVYAVHFGQSPQTIEQVPVRAHRGGAGGGRGHRGGRGRARRN